VNEALTIVGVLAIVGTGALVGYSSQASSPDYRALWWMILPDAIAHTVAAVCYFVWVLNWSRWLVAVVAGIAMLSYLEFTLRTWS
jgi:hypothetical protein